MAYSGYPQDSGQITGSISVVDTGTSTATGSNASSIYTGTPTANSFVTINALNYNSFSLQVSGTWVGTLQVENSYDNGTTWYRVVPQVRGVSNSAALITANGGFVSEAAVATMVRIRAVAWTSGTASIAFMQSPSSEIVRVDNPIRLYDNASSQQATIKPASTAPLAADTALVTTEHPSSPLNVRGQTTGSASLPVVAASDQLFANVTNSISALNGDLLPAMDVSMYRSFNIQVTGAFSATYTFQGSNDNFASANSTVSVPAVQVTTGVGGQVVSSGTTNIIWKGPITFRYLRIRVTAYTSGTVVGSTNISQAPLDSFINYSSVTGTVTATPPNSNASGTITANAQTVNLGTNLIGGGGYAVLTVSGTYAGVSFTISSSTNNGTLVYPVTVYDTNAGVWLKAGSTISPGTNATNAYWVPVAPYANQTRLISTAYTSGTMTIGYGASTNGQPGSSMVQDVAAASLLSFNNAALSALTNVKASSGRLHRIMIQNPNASPAWLQVFNASTTGAVTLGTTQALYPIYIPASGYFEDFFDFSDSFSAGITVAATTTATGSTTVTTGLVVSLGYL